MSTPEELIESGDRRSDPPGEHRTRRPRLGQLGQRILWRFALFALLTLLIIVGMVSYASWRQLEDARLLQDQMAQWTVRSLDTWFLELDNDLAAAASEPQLLDDTAERAENYLRQILLRTPAFRKVTLADARADRWGLELVTVDGDQTSTGRRLFQEEWFLTAWDRGYYISAVEFQAGVPLLILAHAIRQDNETIGVIAAEADLRWAYELVTNARTEKGGYVYVVDATGRPILHDHQPFVAAGQPRRDIEGVDSAVLQQGIPFPYIYSGLNEDANRVLGAYSRMQQLGWTIVAEQPVNTILREFLPLAVGAGGILLLSAFAAFFVGIYISARVGRPIVLLQQGARRIGAGDLEHRILLQRHGELTNLADELNRMAENLQTSQSRQEAWSHELEERVAERTHELSQALDQLRHESSVREHLLQTIREMSSPVIPVMEGITVTPIVGTLDSERAQRMMDDILAGIERAGTRVMILDITGLAVVDTSVANSLVKTAQAAQLLGAQTILVGISPAVAETLVNLGVDLRTLRAAATLQEGLRIGLGILHQQVVAL